ncbi:flagellar hook-length control protein FliK [Kushneria sp. TE3]|uniref:flagellar hook-length control protein FliK n=1 Tax=Kushneria sp. TE3 TaxID=3449832 RepID=UPI003F68957C
MSTITPLLDTLLHNVLGRRADLDRVASRQPDLPLGGVTYTPAVRHGTSDTPDETLERHSEDAAARAKTTDKASARVTVANTPASLGDRTSDSTPRSSTTHFSAEARAISRILEKFPTTAPVVRSDAVMLPAGRPPEVAGLAATLAGQIKHSGLFYESHLRQWLLGQHDQQELLKEPQNRLFQPPAAGQPANADRAYGALNTAMRERVAMQTGDPSTPEGGTTGTTSAQDDLQGILRHQLELMTSPLIRWEGFLTPHIPVQWEIEQEGETAADEGVEEPQRIWRSKLNLILPALGHVDLEISLQDKTINVSGRVEGTYLAWMTVQGRHLDERLTGAGLQLTTLHFSPQGRDDHNEGEI